MSNVTPETSLEPLPRAVTLPVGPPGSGLVCWVLFGCGATVLALTAAIFLSTGITVLTLGASTLLLGIPIHRIVRERARDRERIEAAARKERALVQQLE